MSGYSPGVPAVVEGTVSNDTITVQFDAGELANNPFNSFAVRFGTSYPSVPPRPPGIPVGLTKGSGTSNALVKSVPVPGDLDPRRFGRSYASIVDGTTFFRATVTDLSPMTTYYFYSEVIQVRQSLISTLSDPITTGDKPAPGPTPAPPSSAPTVPELISPATTSSATVFFDIAGIGGNPVPTYTTEYKLSSATEYTPKVANRVLPNLTLYSTTINGLNASTSYDVRSVATNTQGTVESADLTFSTAASGGAPPNKAPSLPSFVSATTTSIVVSMDTAGITGTAPLQYFVKYDTSESGPFTAQAGPATQVGSSTIYQVTASNLAAGSSYYFKSFVSNGSPPAQTSATASGPYQTQPAPPPPPPPPPPGPSVPTFLVVNFLLYDTGDANGTWVIGQQNVPDLGQWILTGPQAGQIIANSGVNAITYLKGLQTAGCKILLSVGGGGLTQPQLSRMFENPTPAATAASVCYALLTNAVGTNPLNFSKELSEWSDFTFDGIDLDVETNMPTAGDGLAFLTAVRGLVPAAILTAAPQVPNLVPPNTFDGNGNGSWYPYPSMSATLGLPPYNTATSTTAWMYPPLLQSTGLNYLFVQMYNQGSSWYPGSLGSQSVFSNALAAWGILCIKSQATVGTGCKVVMGFATADGNPIWNQTNDSLNVQFSLNLANDEIKTQLNLPNVKISDWLAGIGFWNSPSANSVAATIYSPSGNMANLPANATILYCNNTQPPQNPEWNGPIPNTRGTL